MIDWESDPELASLRRDFIGSFESRGDALAAIISKLRSLERSGAGAIPFSQNPARELRVIAHNLAGAAPTYGFESLGETASEIDDWLSDEAGTASAQELLKAALRLDEALKKTEVR